MFKNAFKAQQSSTNIRLIKIVRREECNRI